MPKILDYYPKWIPDWIKPVLNDASMAPTMTGIETLGAENMVTPAKAIASHLAKLFAHRPATAVMATKDATPSALGDLKAATSPSDLVLRALSGTYAMHDASQPSMGDITLPADIVRKALQQ